MKKQIMIILIVGLLGCTTISTIAKESQQPAEVVEKATNQETVSIPKLEYLQLQLNTINANLKMYAEQIKTLTDRYNKERRKGEALAKEINEIVSSTKNKEEK